MARKVPDNIEGQVQGVKFAIREEVKATADGYKNRDEALALYLLGHGPRFICKRIGCTEGELDGWISHGHWKARRAEVYEKAFKSSWVNLANQAGIAQNLAQAFFNDQLRKKMEKDEELDWDELKKLSDIIIGMQKVSRTEEGKPTEYRQDLSLREMKAEIRMILQEDPFQEFLDVTPEKVKVKYDESRLLSESGTGEKDSEA